MGDVVRVKLGDEAFSLRSDRGAEIFAAAEAAVDAKLQELRGQGVQNPRSAALLAAFSIALELHDARLAAEAAGKGEAPPPAATGTPPATPPAIPAETLAAVDGLIARAEALEVAVRALAGDAGSGA